jgi:DNA repair protein RecN (Recombination protein N)
VLEELRVKDLGVIEDLVLDFGTGMTALTGETGAGKTLIVEALQLLLGARGSGAVVRTGAPSALVEARFSVEVLGTADNGDAGERLVAREVSATGRGRAWVDGRMAPIGMLAEAAGPLVDIHGQHEHQSLFDAAAQRAALDGSAGIDAAPVAAGRQRVRELEARLRGLGADPGARARAIDIVRHQIREIEQAELGPDDEEATLREEEERLANAGAHREAAAQVVALLDTETDATSSAAAQLSAATAVLAGFDAFNTWAARLRSLSTDLADIVSDLRAVVDTWEDDPERLGAVQERQRLLADLRRKYGPTLADVRAFADSARANLAELERAEEDAAGLDAAIDAARKELLRLEDALAAARSNAAAPFAAAVQDRLRRLAMPNATFEVQVRGPGGDDVVYLLSANAGESVAPLAKVASGGELARTMLAIRLVAEGGPATVVFDEVDAGVGGEAATALGAALAEVALHRQVLVVTHLAQVAAQADHHVAVRKGVAGGRTFTTASVLSHDERIVELSRMLSGSPESVTAQAHAAELLSHARV